VLAARARQHARFGGGSRTNADLQPREIREHCAVAAAGEYVLRNAVRRLGLSARAYHRVLRLARTIADLAGAERIDTAHLAEAIQYRALDRTRYAERAALS
jgi:magnesium chelatase family protein